MSKEKKERKFTKTELAWILYDVGNSAFTMLACSLISIWFKDLAYAGGLDKETAASSWSFLASIVTIIVAFVSPICGTFADNKGFKKPVFTTALVIGLLGCCALGFIQDYFVFAVVYIITKAAYSSSLVFYDAMLTDVTTEERMDVVSSEGYAWGYLGSCLPFLIALVFYMGGAGMLPIPVSADTARLIGCAVTALWWLLVTVPLLKNYEQKYYVEHEDHAVKMVFKRLRATLHNIFKEDKKVFYFLLAYFFYIDGVDTIIDNAINIGGFLNLGDAECVIILLVIQVVAWLFSLIFGALSKKIDISVLLKVCIGGYLAVAIYANFLNSLFTFGVLAVMVAVFQGSIQALSRSYYGKIIPKESAGEYFGLYDIFSKGASALGSAMLGTVTLWLGDIRPAVSTLSLFFLVGLWAFSKCVKLDKEGK